MERRKLTRLIRVLGLLGSDQPGERASAALAADRLIAAAGTSWSALLDPARAAPANRRDSYGVDERGAAEARMRQLKATNEQLEKQVRSLRRRLAFKADAERRRMQAEEAAGLDLAADGPKENGFPREPD